MKTNRSVQLLHAHIYTHCNVILAFSSQVSIIIFHAATLRVFDDNKKHIHIHTTHVVVVVDTCCHHQHHLCSSSSREVRVLIIYVI